MANMNLRDFMFEWTRQVKELIEPKVKLTPIFNTSLIDHNATYSKSFEYFYEGDGRLNLLRSGTGNVLFSTRTYVGYNEDGSDKVIPVIIVTGMDNRPMLSSVSGTAHITSEETDNYKAGEWVFDYAIGE